MSEVINSKLAAMRAAGKVKDIKAKGAAGEAAAFDVVHAYRAAHGGILKQGFTYPYATNRQGTLYLGNIFWDAEKSKYYDLTSFVNDEIDILYISNCRIFPIEIKAYHDDTMVVTDTWLYRKGQPVEKSPYTQAEKHARHLYHQLFDVIPNGDPKYIVPLVCFVDECTIDDQRSPKMQYYLPTTTLDSLAQTISERDFPIGKQGYTLDLDMIGKKLKEIERERDLD